MIELHLATRFLISPSITSNSPFSSHEKPKITIPKTRPCCSTRSLSADFLQTRGVQVQTETLIPKKTKRVFLLDVNPLCYSGSTPSLQSFGFWFSLLLRRVSLTDPVIAVFDGENGAHRRRQLLPSYKSHRWKPTRQYSKGFVARSRRSLIENCLAGCHVPAISLDGHEADDVIATLSHQAQEAGLSVVVASPDKDFKQLLSDNVAILAPLVDLKRWSFYTVRHYAAQHGQCDPCSDLSLRCLLGDEADGVPGIQSVAPGFGRKTALKLMEKHGSLENLLRCAAVRTVGKPYAQDALVRYADYLRRNYEVLSLQHDVGGVVLQDEWLRERDPSGDEQVFAEFFEALEGDKKKRMDNAVSKLIM